MSTNRKHVTVATIAKRFGMTEDEVLWSRKRGRCRGIAGYTIPDGKGRKLVFPADLKPEDSPEEPDDPPTEPEDGDETWESQ